MPRASRDEIRFVQALVTGVVATNVSGLYLAAVGERRTRLAEPQVRALMSAGVLQGDAGKCTATSEARTWLRRQLSETDAYPAQHRIETRAPDGTVRNLEESPLARLAARAKGEAEPFLAPHQIEAGERVRRLAERAQLQPRLTMAYSAAHTAGGRRQGGGVAEITDMAAEARKSLAEISRVLPRDCAGVVLDVCGLLKGLQVVEAERGWPRRSAKLVLRIGLDQLAQHYGLAPHAVGAASRRDRAWLDDGARPDRFE